MAALLHTDEKIIFLVVLQMRFSETRLAVGDTLGSWARGRIRPRTAASEAAEAIVPGAIQTLGGYGNLKESGLAKIYCDVQVFQIDKGTDMQRVIIVRIFQGT